MPLEVARGEQLGKHVLLKGGDGAGVEAQLLFKVGQKLFGKDHVAHAYGGGYGP